MFAFTQGAQKRFYRKTGDGSLRFVRRAIPPDTAFDPGTREAPNYIAMPYVTLRDDSEVDEAALSAGCSHTDDLRRFAQALHPADTLPLSIFDPQPDATSLETDGLSATPGALVEEMVVGFTASWSGGDSPDADFHRLLTHWGGGYNHNQTVYTTHIQTMSEAEIRDILGLYAVYVVVSALVTLLAGGYVPDIIALAINAILAIGAISLMMVFMTVNNERRKVLRDAFIKVCEDDSAIIDKAVMKRQSDLITQQKQLYAELSLFHDTGLMAGGDDRQLNGLKDRVWLVFRNLHRLGQNRLHLCIAMRTIGMIHLACGAEALYGAVGRPWRLGDLALGLLPKIGMRLWLLVGIGLFGLTLVFVPMIVTLRLDDLLTPRLIPLTDLPEKLPTRACLLALAQGGLQMIVLIIAWVLILKAHARVKTEIDADTVRHITKEATLKTCKGPQDAHAEAGIAEHLVLAVFRLWREDGKRR